MPRTLADGRKKRKRSFGPFSATKKEAVEDPYSVNRILKSGITRPPSDPPVLGEPDAPVGAPRKPKPSQRSGAVAVPEPEPDDAFVVLTPKRSNRDTTPFPGALSFKRQQS